MNSSRTCALRKHFNFFFILLFLKGGFFLIFDMCHSQSLSLISIVFRENLNGKIYIKKRPTFEYTTCTCIHLLYERS